HPDLRRQDQRRRRRGRAALPDGRPRGGRSVVADEPWPGAWKGRRQAGRVFAAQLLSGLAPLHAERGIADPSATAEHPMDTLHLAPTPAVEAEIRSALHHYARTIDQKRYYDWLNLFTDDGSYAVITYENLQDQGLYLYKDDGRAALEERVVYLV